MRDADPCTLRTSPPTAIRVWRAHNRWQGESAAAQTPVPVRGALRETDACPSLAQATGVGASDLRPRVLHGTDVRSQSRTH